MKKTLSLVLAALMLLSVFPALTAGAEENQNAPTGFKTWKALFVHAVSGSDDGEAWAAWQSAHDESFAVANQSRKYFFLPSSADKKKVDIYNAFGETVTINGTAVAAGKTGSVSYDTDSDYTFKAEGTTYTLRFMRSNAEAAIYVNNSDADGNGTELMSYLNVDKSRKAAATGAIVTPDGSVDNTAIKKIKGRGNTTWGKPKKAYNITYDKKVSIAGMDKSKKYSILANYQDDSLSRNRFLYDLSDAVGMPYASDSRYVDFYVNGFYWGSYQMTEKVAVGSSSLVKDFEEEDYLNEDGSVKEDFPFLCEVDAGAADGEDYYVSLSNGIKVTIKAPELEEGDKGYEEVKKYVKEKFTAFYEAAGSKTQDLSQYADIDSLTKLYLINELGKNWDSGVSSMFFTYKPDENGVYKFYGSPVWDYDNSLGNAVGVGNELKNMGVTDYTDYTGWWCKFKGKRSTQKSSTNIMNRISVNTAVTEAAPKIWAEKFIPAINHFAGVKLSDEIGKELYTADEYYKLVRDSAAMNYTSGWLLNTGSWISDHTSLNTASYDAETNTYSVNKTATKYNNDFEGMFNFCRDWMISRAAWLSKELAVEPVKVEEKDDIAPPVVEKKTAAAYKLSKTSYVYNGKAKTPTVTVKDSDGNTVSADNYTVAYAKGRKNVGRYSVKVTMTGEYTGSKTLYFIVKPASTKLKALTPKKKSFTAKWTKKTVQTTGYRLQYATNAKFTKSVKTKTVKSAKTAKLTIKKLKAKTYYARIRVYKTVSGKKYYSAWSKPKSVKVKK